MSDVLIATEGAAGRIRLNRPKALNALNTGMCAAILDALEAWRGDDAVRAILIDHAEGRGFCAGGDIRMIRESAGTDGADAREFFLTEYRMNYRLFTNVKPIVAFMDGITMGGGVGLSLPARYRVATENTTLAMPETGIGLFPDVGGGWYLSRLPGRMGQYVGLTGYRLNGIECVLLGLATHYLPSAMLVDAKTIIASEPTAVDYALSAVRIEIDEEPEILRNREAIDRLFASDEIEDVLAALSSDDSEFARSTLATLATRSPQSMKVTLRLLKMGAAMQDFADELRLEYQVVVRVVQRPDFAEGVRAVIVDKDNAPRWDPAAPEGVSDHMIDRIFAPLPDGEEWTPA